jgi:hypothetical protein
LRCYDSYRTRWASAFSQAQAALSKQPNFKTKDQACNNQLRNHTGNNKKLLHLHSDVHNSTLCDLTTIAKRSTSRNRRSCAKGANKDTRLHMHVLHERPAAAVKTYNPSVSEVLNTDHISIPRWEQGLRTCRTVLLLHPPWQPANLRTVNR